MRRTIARALVALGVFVVGLLIMGAVCTGAWDAFVNGKLYYCTDGGTLDFICVERRLTLLTGQQHTAVKALMRQLKRRECITLPLPQAADSLADLLV